MPKNLHDTHKKPPVEIRPRTQNIFILVNASMSERRRTLLNAAMHECMDAFSGAAVSNPYIDMRMGCIAFSEQARWHITPAPTSPKPPKWIPPRPGETADAGAAIRLLAEYFESEKMPKRCLRPIVVLISDGKHSDESGYADARKRLDASPYGFRSNRFSVGTGADCNWKQLGVFANRSDIGMLELSHTDDLAGFLFTDIWTFTSKDCPCCPVPPDEVILPMPPSEDSLKIL